MATAAMTIHIGPRMVDSFFDVAGPDGWSCQPPGGPGGDPTVWLRRVSGTQSGWAGADGGGGHRGRESSGKDWLDEASGGAGTATRSSSPGTAGESAAGGADAEAEGSEEPFASVTGAETRGSVADLKSERNPMSKSCLQVHDAWSRPHPSQRILIL